MSDIQKSIAASAEAGEPNADEDNIKSYVKDGASNVCEKNNGSISPAAVDDEASKITASRVNKSNLARVIPTQVTDTFWIWSACSEGYHRQDDPEGGKWLVFLNKTRRGRNGLTYLDNAWFKIEDACNRGILYRAKVSTAMIEPHARDDGSGVIVCYTKDFTDKEDVLKTAETIRSILYNETRQCDFLYKTNPATEARLYPKLNIKGVTHYKYDRHQRFHERVKGQWKLLDKSQLPNGLESDSEESD